MSYCNAPLYPATSHRVASRLARPLCGDESDHVHAARYCDIRFYLNESCRSIKSRIVLSRLAAPCYQEPFRKVHLILPLYLNESGRVPFGLAAPSNRVGSAAPPSPVRLRIVT
jgi:hypothetical protein